MVGQRAKCATTRLSASSNSAPVSESGEAKSRPMVVGSWSRSRGRAPDHGIARFPRKGRADKVDCVVQAPGLDLKGDQNLSTSCRRSQRRGRQATLPIAYQSLPPGRNKRTAERPHGVGTHTLRAPGHRHHRATDDDSNGGCHRGGVSRLRPGRQGEVPAGSPSCRAVGAEAAVSGGLLAESHSLRPRSTRLAGGHHPHVLSPENADPRKLAQSRALPPRRSASTGRKFAVRLNHSPCSEVLGDAHTTCQGTLIGSAPSRSTCYLCGC